MSHGQLRIETDLFRAVDVQVEVNTDLYHQLLAELSIDVEEPTLPTTHLFPSLSWLNEYSSVDRETYRTVYSRTGHGGNYDPDDTLISVACPPEAPRANKLLLHEAKHWGQDMHGDLAASQKWLNASLTVAGLGFIGGIVGIASGIYAKNPDVVGTSALPTVLSPLGLLWYKTVGCKDEREARRFENNPDILATYGRIITYHTLR